MVLNLPQVPSHPCASNRTPRPPTRSPRFVTRLPVRFRLSDGRGWRDGVSQNISRSGVLFQTAQPGAGPRDAPAAEGTRVELIFDLPATSDPLGLTQVQCEGRLVRACGSWVGAAPVSLAVAVRCYTVVAVGEGVSTRGPEPPATTSALPPARRPHALPAASDWATGARPARRSSRVGIGLQRPVTAEVDTHGLASGPVSAHIASLSPVGAFLDVGADYPIASSITLCFRLPPRFVTISCAAVVRSRRAGRGIGVEFVDLAAADRDQIEKFVARLLAGSAPRRT